MPGIGGRSGRGTWGENELVVRFRVLALCSEVADADLLRRAVDGLDRLSRADVELVAIYQSLDRTHQQLATVSDLAADVVGHPTVGKRRIVAPLDEDNLGPIIEPPRPGCRTRSPRHAPYDHDLHLTISLVVADGLFYLQQVVSQAWFQGMRASSIPMPHVSVIPANISPAPTNPLRPTQ